MNNQSKNQIISQNLKNMRIPMMIVMLVFSFVSVFINSVMKGNEVVGPPSLGTQFFSSAVQVALMSLNVIIEFLVIWLSPKIVLKYPRLLVFGQLIFAMTVNFMVNGVFVINLIGLFTILLIQSIVIFQKPVKILITIVSIYVALIVGYALIASAMRGLFVLQSLIFMGIIAWYFYRIYQKAVEERNRAEDLVDELKVAYSQIEEVTVKAERQRIARDLHDTLTQELAGISLQVSAAIKNLDKGNTDVVREILVDTNQASRGALRESRELLSELRTIQHDNLSDRLAMLIDAFQKGHQLKIRNMLKDVPEYSPTQMTEIVRVVVEALNNVDKHSDATEVIIRSNIQNHEFVLQVIDFGSGFDMTKSKQKGHFGLTGMQERADNLDGRLDVSSQVGEGTTVTLRIPIVKKGE